MTDLLTPSYAELASSQHAICVTDAQLAAPGPLIEYVNSAYLELFCCEEDDVLGRSPRFAQGPLTSRDALDRVRAGLEAGTPVNAQVVNYRRTGEAFRLRWTIDPVRERGEVVRFVGVLTDVTLDDRLRRRLTALDTLATVWRSDVSPMRESAAVLPPEAVRDALCQALSPVLAEVGSALVHVEGAADGSHGGAVAVEPTHTTVDRERHELLEEIEIVGVGSVALSVHPDGRPLLDRALVAELCDQTAWLVELAGGLAR